MKGFSPSLTAGGVTKPQPWFPCLGRDGSRSPTACTWAGDPPGVPPPPALPSKSFSFRTSGPSDVSAPHPQLQSKPEPPLCSLHKGPGLLWPLAHLGLGPTDVPLGLASTLAPGPPPLPSSSTSTVPSRQLSESHI